MQTLILSPYFGKATESASVDSLWDLAEARFGGYDPKSNECAPHILGLCHLMAPNTQPDIPMRYALSQIWRAHLSSNLYDARGSVPFINEPIITDTSFDAVRVSIDEVLVQHADECIEPTWAINACMFIEEAWRMDGYNQRIEVIDFGDGHVIDVAGIAVDIAREQRYSGANAFEQLSDAQTCLMARKLDQHGDVCSSLRTWFNLDIGLDSVEYTVLVGRVSALLPSLLMRF
jgi:hypothetical protein